MDGKQIKEVTPQGIVYLDDNGDEKFIDFAICHQNYVQRMTTPEYWERFKKLNDKTDADWDWYVEWGKGWKEVGVYDALGARLGKGFPFIDFHTAPSTLFLFASPEDCISVHITIREAGWEVFDLT